jgi:hypothetical protein
MMYLLMRATNNLTDQPRESCGKDMSTQTGEYKETSIISSTGAAIWSKINFGPAGYHHPGSSSLPRVCTIPSASAIFKCILEFVFCKGVHRLRFCHDHLRCVIMAAFQFYLQSGKQESKVDG